MPRKNKIDTSPEIYKLYGRTPNSPEVLQVLKTPEGKSSNSLYLLEENGGSDVT